MPASAQPTAIIEGSFRLVATRDLPAVPAGAPRRSPNRRRAVARIFIWNFALAAVVVGVPVLF